MKAGTLFSGIGAPEAAAPWIDWRWCAEIDAFASAVHAARFPDTPNLGDVMEIDSDAVEPVDLVVFGSPCQSFSVAGKRLGLDDPRGNLALVALRLIGKLRPDWLVFENVPGLLSSDGGRDFGAFLGLLGECGYGFAYRILDAQHFRIPQRRRRLFVVGRLGDWRGPAAVLFEPESLRGDPAPGRQAGERIAAKSLCGSDGGIDREDRHNLIAATVSSKWAKGTGGPAGDEHCNVIACDILGTPATNGARQTGVHTALRSRAPGASEASTTTVIAHTLRADGFDASEDGIGRGTPIIPIKKGTWARNSITGDPEEALWTLDASCGHAVALPIAFSAKDHGGDAGDIAPTLRAGMHSGSHATAGVMPAVMFDPTARQPEWSINRPLKTDGPPAVAFRENVRGEVDFVQGGVTQSLSSGGGKPGQGYPAAMQGMSVRRLTPTECERLQGLPDNWTAITYRGKPAADGPRYRALGNSMAVPVIAWILERVRAVREITP